MFKVFTCIAGQHDLRIVVLAAVFCVVASFMTLSLYRRSLEDGGKDRSTWVLLAGFAGGSGIWTTHFLGMLAYEPTLPARYALAETLVSLATAIAGTTIAFLIARPSSRRRQVAAGLVLGLAIVGMHFIGMRAFHPQGMILWDRPQVVLSVLLGVGLSVAAMAVCGDCRRGRRMAAAGGLMAVAICAMHFLAMSAASILPSSMVFAGPAILRGELIIGVRLEGVLVIVGVLTVLLIDSQARRRNAETMSSLFEATPVPMCLVEPGTLRFLAVNESALETYGYSREQFMTMSAYDLTDPEEHAALRARAGAAPAYAGQRNWRHRRADGVELLVQPFVRSVPYKGEMARIVTLFDVTERVRAAESLARARDAAEAANRAKSDFLANMSHEIRTPLNGVLGVAGVLKTTALEPRQAEMVGIIEASASTLEHLLSDLLEMSRLDAGALTLRRASFDLPKLLRETSALYAPAARERGVACRVVIEPEAATWAVGDADRVRQIIGALLSNAVKFTEAGEISLYATFTAPDLFRFVVSDTGLGFDAAFHSRLFKRFEQADASITRRHGGSGVGLAIAHDLAERMGGELYAQSKRGRGSVFTLDLPLAPCAAADGVEPATEPVPRVA